MIIEEKYDNITFTVEFLNSRPMRFSHKGKHWPLTTQCIIRANNLIVGLGEVIKHDKDPDNIMYARSLSAKKAFNNSTCRIWKELRERLWKQILNKQKDNV